MSAGQTSEDQLRLNVETKRESKERLNKNSSVGTKLCRDL